MKQNILVVGSGFRGFCDALALLKNPKNSVTIIDAAPFFGGVMSSFQVGEFFVDKGCHIFDSVQPELLDQIDEILGGKLKYKDFYPSSAFKDELSIDFSLPNLNTLDDATKAQIKYEFLELAKNPPGETPSKNLNEHFSKRYGETVCKIYSDIFERIYRAPAEHVSARAAEPSLLGRVKFLPDPEMEQLKQDPWLDTVLAVRRRATVRLKNLQYAYPGGERGLRGWCEAAQSWLEQQGVSILLGEKIEAISKTSTGLDVKTNKGLLSADKIVWSNDGVDALAHSLDIPAVVDQHIHSTPQLIYTFVTQASEIRDLVYLHNYGPDGRIFRISTSGLYSEQTRADGASFLTCECPAEVGSDDWTNAEENAQSVWDELKKLEFISDKGTLLEYDVKRVPKTFRMPKPNHQAILDEFCEDVNKISDRLIVRNTTPFFRREIYTDSLALEEMV